MALRYIDSFDHYQTAQLTAKWSTVVFNAPAPTIEPGLGRCGTQALLMALSAVASVTKGAAFSGATAVFGFAIKYTSFSGVGTDTRFFIIGSAFGSHLAISRANDGTVFVERTDGVGVLLGQSIPDVLRLGEWYYMEVKATIDNAAGAVEVRLNGVAVITVAGVDTQSVAGAVAAVTSLSFESTGACAYLIDDLYALDSTGPAPNNDFLGDVRVEYLQPTGPGAHQDWSLIGALSHWEAVDDGATPDDDTTYIHTATIGQVDTEEYENTGLPSGLIFGLQIGIYARKTDSGFREVAPVIRHAGTDYLGANQAPSMASYNYLIQVFETDPGTGLAWTIADVNADEYGVQLTV